MKRCIPGFSIAVCCLDVQVAENHGVAGMALRRWDWPQRGLVRNAIKRLPINALHNIFRPISVASCFKLKIFLFETDLTNPRRDLFPRRHLPDRHLNDNFLPKGIFPTGVLPKSINGTEKTDPVPRKSESKGINLRRRYVRQPYRGAPEMCQASFFSSRA